MAFQSAKLTAAKLTAVTAAAIAILQAQSVRPEAGPFNAAGMTVQAPPAQGIAVRAGRLFDPKSGINLVNQVILIKGDRVTSVQAAATAKIPEGALVNEIDGGGEVNPRCEFC